MEWLEYALVSSPFPAGFPAAHHGWMDECFMAGMDGTMAFNCIYPRLCSVLLFLRLAWSSDCVGSLRRRGGIGCTIRLSIVDASACIMGFRNCFQMVLN